MAKRRSKKERVLAEAKRRSNPVVALKQVSKADSTVKPGLQLNHKVNEMDYLQNIFGYDPKLIFKDLKKTVLIFIFVLLVLLAIALLYT